MIRVLNTFRNIFVSSRKWVCIILLILTICSCRSVKYVPVESSVDSIVVEKLVEVQLPPDSSTIRAENGRVVLSWLDIANSKNAQAQLTIDSLGNLLAKMRTKPDTVYLPSKEVTVTKKEKVPYPVEKKLTRWEKFRLDVGGYAIFTVVTVILIVVGYMVYKLKKGG